MPTSVSVSPLTIAENAAGATIGAVTVVDPDAGDSHTFSVNDPRFEIVGGNLKLKTGQSLNFETAASVPLQVTAADAGGLAVSRTVTVTVTNVNEPPTAVSVNGLAVDENANGAVIGPVSVIDPDASDSHTFSVSDQRFEIASGSLKLRPGHSLNFEIEPAVAMIVTATDAGGLSRSELVTVTVRDVNEAPDGISVTTVENEPGADLGRFVVADMEGGPHTFTLSDPRFQMVNSRLQLRPGVSLDFEAASRVVLDMTATDAGGLSVTKPITVTVTDENESPTAITLGNQTVEENAVGATLGPVTVTDPDTGDTHTFTLSDSRFQIVSGSLRLRPGMSLDFEASATVPLSITATDAGGLSITRAFTITVTDVVETLPDADGDGIMGHIEAAAPNDGDGNADGIRDADQAHVASLDNLAGQFVTLVTSNNLPLNDVKFVPLPPSPPASIDFELGLVDFRAQVSAPGGELTLTFLVHDGQQFNTFYKFGPTRDNPAPHWYRFIYDGDTGAEIFSDRIVVHLRDGGRGDDDLLANGVIVDPGTPALDTRAHLHQNPALRFNVNDDEKLSALDALAIIAELNRTGGRPLPLPLPLPISRTLFLDVNGDDQVTINDALLVIGDLNANGPRTLAPTVPSGEPLAVVEESSITADFDDLATDPTRYDQPSETLPAVAPLAAVPVEPIRWEHQIDSLFDDDEDEAFWDLLFDTNLE